MIKSLVCFSLTAMLWFSNQAQAELPIVRLGVLQFGTVNWELDVIKRHKLDHKNGFDLRITPLGGKNATHVALQGGAVDVIVSDWIWVSRQRSQGRAYTFSPYSVATGGLMVHPQRGFTHLADLKDHKLGVAGGALDKTWLLLRAYSKKTLGDDLADLVQPSFAAPPLLNQLALRDELDGVINFWHYAARLKAQGFHALLELRQILGELGIHRPIPMIGWVFSEQWAAGHGGAISGLLQASRDAKQLLHQSDVEWLHLRKKMKADNEGIFVALRNGFRAGIPTCFGSEEIDAARKTFRILAQQGGEALAGTSKELSDGTFWPGFTWERCAGT